jgi:hypothetical protein
MSCEPRWSIQVDLALALALALALVLVKVQSWLDLWVGAEWVRVREVPQSEIQEKIEVGFGTPTDQ